MATVVKRINDFTLGFQIRYCLVIIASLIVSNLLLYHYYLDHDLGGNYFQALVTLTEVERALPSSLLITFLVQCLLILLFTLALVIFFSRKVAGIIYRFEHLLREIAAGDLQHLAKNRSSDQIKSLFSALNCLITSLRTVYSSVHEVENQLRMAIDDIAIGKSPDRESLRRKIRQTRSLFGNSDAKGGME